MTQSLTQTIARYCQSTSGSFTATQLAAVAGVTRQAIHRHLKRLVESGALTATGKGRATRYTSTRKAARFEQTVAIATVDEDRLWRDVRPNLPELGGAQSRNADAIARYAFTEMVNNAIDHSGAQAVTVRAELDGDACRFTVADAGIGVFENVRVCFGLPDLLNALQEISKGKTSTQPERHTGEGIFFTSKACDRFELEANGLRWMVDNLIADQAIGAAPPGVGTTVRFEVSLTSELRLEDLFARYTHDFDFDTTRTVVKLFNHGVAFVSRSEAKRLLNGLQKFRHVVLDFKNVEAVGQGFADEVFRIWARAHPEIELHAENMIAPVAFMIERAKRTP